MHTKLITNIQDCRKNKLTRFEDSDVDTKNYDELRGKIRKYLVNVVQPHAHIAVSLIHKDEIQ